MQHYSCPTRMLDWTASAFVGAYFAVSQLPQKDGALFVVGAEALHHYNARYHPDMIPTTGEKLTAPNMPDFVLFTWPDLRSSRVVAQQGHFSVSTNLLAPHDETILKACAVIAAEQPGRTIQKKIIIPAELKPVILQQLRAMNVAPHALFPTLDGLGRSLADLASLQAILSRPPREPV
jgi:FRG domain